MATKHLTRRELKREDTIYATLSKASSALLQRPTLVLTIAGVVVAAVLGFFLWRNYEQSRDVQAQKEFGDALEIFHGAVVSSSSTPQSQSNRQLFASEEEKYRKALAKVNQVYQQYPSRKVGILAFYYTALAQHNLKNDKEAIRILQQLDKNSDPDVRTVARAALAEIYRAGGMNQQAMQVYQSMLKDPASLYPKDALLANMGETAEAMGKNSDAAGYYQRLTREHAQSAYVSEAQTRLAILKPPK